MKKLVVPLILILLFGCATEQESRIDAKDASVNSIDTINIVACFSCERLVKAWVEEFEKLHPDANFSLDITESSSCIGSLNEGSHIAFFSRDLTMEEDTLPYCVSSVAKHGLVVIVNENNPYIDIIRKGLTIQSLKAVYDQKSWSPIARENKHPLHAYYRTVGAGNTRNFIKFLDLEEEDISGKLVESDIDMVEAIKADPYGLGYCSHINAYDLNTNAQLEGIAVIPLKDNFGRTHKFYDSLSMLRRAIWAGKYQCHLYPNIYLILKEKPTDPHIKAFMKWVFTDGQHVVEREGYVKLRGSEIGCRVKEL